MRALGGNARSRASVYLTGGATAVLHGWRTSTVDVDLKIVPDADDLLRAIPELKERLQINVELASPSDFIPELAGWQGRSPFVAQEGPLTFHEYDFYGQALSKIERGHERDLRDARELVTLRLVDQVKLLDEFARIESELYRFPAISPKRFREALEGFVSSLKGGG
jgi:hypothetical protein